jgi:hypothetical protein
VKCVLPEIISQEIISEGTFFTGTYLGSQIYLQNDHDEKKQLKDSHPFMTTIKYKKMKVNHGGEV